MIHAYYGDGKGKTSAAFGLALRAVMRGFPVAVVQFLKGTTRYGEVRAAPLFNIEVHQFGRACVHPERPNCKGCTDCHINPNAPEPDDFRNAERALETAEKLSQRVKLLILDEVLYALAFGLVGEERLVSFLSRVKGTDCEVVLTGNPLPESLKTLCDYISHFKNRKHHIEKGLVSVVGVDQ
ncbi:MAG: cob(I)yrinic acid a,c-diamide adenosyltransferase [Planctomycetota bacterium]|nr:MAG: cob(I)yrinic acid a,c-diamide adenosyltransferase [Planctomycetota bacterium]